MTLTYLMLVGLRQLEDLELMAEEAGCSDYIKIAFKVNGYMGLN